MKYRGITLHGDTVTHAGRWLREIGDAEPLCSSEERINAGNYHKEIDCPECVQIVQKRRERRRELAVEREKRR